MACHYLNSRAPGGSYATYESPQTYLDTSPKSEPGLELHSRAAPSVEAHHPSVGPDTGINSGGRRIKNTSRKIVLNVKAGSNYSPKFAVRQEGVSIKLIFWGFLK